MCVCVCVCVTVCATVCVTVTVTVCVTVCVVHASDLFGLCTGFPLGLTRRRYGTCVLTVDCSGTFCHLRARARAHTHRQRACVCALGGTFRTLFVAKLGYDVHTHTRTSCELVGHVHTSWSECGERVSVNEVLHALTHTG